MPAPVTPHYPAAQRTDLVETLHGHPVADPYRWLEDPADTRTVAWSAAQDELTRTALDALPGRGPLADRLTELLRAGSVGVPVWRAGRSFRTWRGPDQEHPVVLVTEPDGTERVLLDPMTLDPSGSTTLDSWAPSLEGDLLAYLTSVGGDEESRLFVLDVATGKLAEGPVSRTKYTALAWLPGGDELYYVRRLPPGQVPPGEEQFHRRVWRHRIGADADTTDVLVDAPGMYADPTFYFGVDLSRDGRWLVVTASPGTAPRDSVWFADLAGDGEPRKLLDVSEEVSCSAWVGRDGRLYLLTTLDAPRWRLCVADPARPEPEHWTELIAEEPDSVLGATCWLEPAGDGEPLLVVERTRHAVAELSLHDAASGTRLGAVPLPGAGSLVGLSAADEDTPERRGQVWIGWTDFTTPPCVHRFSLVTGRTELEQAAPGAVAVPVLVTRQLTYRSADGTEVRMFVIAGRDEPDAPRPTLLTGYGGFSVSREPGYSPTALIWAEAGGVWAQPALRGGGEEGEEWHRAGMREYKQHTFADLHAAADALVAGGWTTPGQLAIAGGSNGGLLVGAALTQRPAAYRAVVCSAPLLDMVRYEQFLLGRTWNDEYGSAEDPVELGWLLSYSPYHHVRPGTGYPAVLFTVFEGDSRVDPLHARKMCAALQHATTEAASGAPGERPVLLRRETDVGHGARSVSRSVALATDQTAFLAVHTGLDLTVLAPPGRVAR